jgi:hypothetical protein
MSYGEEKGADGVRDFDFLFGRWDVKHRRLVEPLTGSSGWIDFDGVAETRGLLGSQMNIEEHMMAAPGVSGIALRLFDVVDCRWSIYWVSERDGKLQPPVVGGFRDGIGLFDGADRHRDRPIRVRYTWDRVETDSPRWQQAFSPDEGASWETNWVMEFSRRES